MLPQVFRADSPVFELKLPLEYQIELEGLVAGLAGRGFPHRLIGLGLPVPWRKA